LLAHFVDKVSQSSALPRPDFSPEALDLLYDYGYPGNVREMQNIVERIALLYPGTKIMRQHLPP
jgi:DNA-binding NtrC family response regulator